MGDYLIEILESCWEVASGSFLKSWIFLTPSVCLDTMKVGKSYTAWIQQADSVIKGSLLLHPSGLRDGKGKALNFRLLG